MEWVAFIGSPYLLEAIDKGGTMESLFHPYVRGFLLRAEKGLFLFI